MTGIGAMAEKGLSPASDATGGAWVSATGVAWVSATGPCVSATGPTATELPGEAASVGELA